MTRTKSMIPHNLGYANSCILNPTVHIELAMSMTLKLVTYFFKVAYNNMIYNWVQICKFTVITIIIQLKMTQYQIKQTHENTF